MKFDTFVGLPLNQSIASAVWDSGGMSWSAGAMLIGDGSDAVKATGTTQTFMGNYSSLDGQIGQAVFFKLLPGRADANSVALMLFIDSTGTQDVYAPTSGAYTTVGSYSLLYIKDGTTQTAAQANCVIADNTEYCLELVKTSNANGLEYRSTLYNASGGVRGTVVATQIISLATAAPGTNKRVYISGQGEYTRISRVESVDAVAATPVSFTGPVPTRNGAVGSAASFANAGFFAGSATPFTYSLQAGILPAGLTLSSSTGIISGTPTAAGTQSGIVIRATDANSATADTNAYSIVIAASNAAPTFPGTIANLTGTGGAAITPVNVSGQFSDTDALTYSASPAGTAWPSGLVVNSSTGIISGTVATSTTTGLRVRATDTAAQTVDSNTFNVTISASAPTTGSFTTDAWTSSGTLRASQAFTGTWYSGGAPGTAGGTATLVSGTLSAGGTATFSAPLGAGFLIGATSDGGRYYQAGTVA